MPFLATHFYITAHWDYGGGDETGQFGWRTHKASPITQADLDGSRTAWTTFWSSVPIGFPAGFKLAFLKAAHIGTDGHYVPDENVVVSNFSPTVAGGGGTTVRYPLQLATVVTLTTALLRGRASKGRCYCPVMNTSLDPGYTMPGTNCQALATGFATLLTATKTAYGTPYVMSGSFAVEHEILGTRVDNLVDTMRSRARQQTGTRFTAVVA